MPATKKAGFAPKRRMNVILLFFCLLFAALAARLFVLQILSHGQYTALAAKQHRVMQEIFPRRGTISASDKDGNRHLIAGNRIIKNLAASPVQIPDPNGHAQKLSAILGIPEDILGQKLNAPSDTYKLIAKAIDEDMAAAVETLRLEGIFIEEERRRQYPRGDFAAHLAGFVSKINEREEGRYGLERMYEEQLSGAPGFLEGAKDSAGFLIALGKRLLHPPAQGSDLILTIDANIQFKTEQTLEETIEKWRAPSGIALVMEPKTGRILAMSAEPSFDPGEYGKEKDLSVFLNPLVEKQFEFGSVLKPVTMAAAIEEGVVAPYTTYTDSGSAKIGGYTVKNFDGNAYGTQTMTEVLEKSLNTGMVFVAGQLGQERHLSFLQKFGLGEKTGIDLPGEIGGDISNLFNGRAIDFATASFGQGIAITPIQLASAISAIANGGSLMTPYVTERVVHDDGNGVRREPIIRRQVISAKTSETITKMLVSVVRKGFENRAGVEGYFVAAKTGTAQIPRSDGRGYDPDRVIHTFVGYAPAFDPKFLILLQLNEPIGNRFASNTLTSAFHDLTEYILNYYEIPPDEKK